MKGMAMCKARVLIMVVFSVVSCAVHNATAGRPLAIDDADPVEIGLFELEAGFGYEWDSGSAHWEIPFGLTYGLVCDVEVGVGFGGQFERHKELAGKNHEDGLSDLEIGAKWQFLESCPLGVRHALASVAKIPTADEDKGLGSGEADFDLTWIASRSIGERTGIHLNLGCSWIGGPDHDLVHGGVSIDYQLAEPVQWVGEVFAEDELDSDADAVAACNTGLRWTPVETLTLDAAVGTKLRGDAPDFTTTVGLTWAFGTDG